MDNMDLVIDKWSSDSYMVSVERFKNLVSKLPDDGEIRIEVEKDYEDRKRLSLETVDGFALKGRVFVIKCTTNV